MTEELMKDFVPIPVDTIIDNSVTDFDVFLTVGGRSILYGAKGYRWFRRELSDLLRYNISHFLIREEDLKKLKTYETIAKLPQIQKNLAPLQRIVNLETIGAQFLECLYSSELTESAIGKAKELSAEIVTCLQEDLSSMQHLSGLGDKDYYTYVHSVRVSVYSVGIAMELGITSEDALREIALGGIFHDIGKKDVPLELLNKTGALSEAEWEIVKKHPEKGIEQIKDSILSQVPREIILHHHEKMDGSGYPDGLKKEKLLPEVRIATLADIYDALTSSRTYQNKRTRFEALDFIKHNLAGKKIDEEIYKALISCLVKN